MKDFHWKVVNAFDYGFSLFRLILNECILAQSERNTETFDNE